MPPETLLEIAKLPTAERKLRRDSMVMLMGSLISGMPVKAYTGLLVPIENTRSMDGRIHKRQPVARIERSEIRERPHHT